MGYEAAVLRRAAKQLAQRRQEREERQERQRREIYAQLPRVAEIDRELKGTIYQIITASLREGRDPAPSIKVIRDKNLDLQAEKARLLTEHGWPADALDDKPACPKCGDTGWVGAAMCSCLKELCARDREEAGEARDDTRRYLGCDLLILDDLGSELTTPFVQSALYTLINSRLSADKRTVISSNLSMDQVRQRYTPQIASRLEGEYRVLPFYGEDIRLLRKGQL